MERHELGLPTFISGCQDRLVYNFTSLIHEKSESVYLYEGPATFVTPIAILRLKLIVISSVK